MFYFSIYRKSTLSKGCVLFLTLYVLSVNVRGQVSETHYENGNLKSVGKVDIRGKQGEWKYYYSSGQLNAIEFFKDGRLHGTATSYCPEGNQISTEQYQNDVLTDSAFYYYCNGQLRRKGIYIDGLYGGEWLSYYENENIKHKGTYSLGVPDGYWWSYNDQGILIQEGAYKEGKEEGMWKFYRDSGLLIYQGAYSNGIEIGEWYEFTKKGKRKLYRNYN